MKLEELNFTYDDFFEKLLETVLEDTGLPLELLKKKEELLIFNAMDIIGFDCSYKWYSEWELIQWRIIKEKITEELKKYLLTI